MTSIVFVLALFSGSLSAELSDEAKREFMEKSARPQGRGIFYRWQSEERMRVLLRTGEMTPDLYEHYMSKQDPWGGAGFYVSRDMASSSEYGTTLIQVELEPGYKYLDLSDPAVKNELSAKNISVEDAFRLNPEVAVTDIKDGKDWLVLKFREGMKFKPFSGRGLDLKDLERAYKDLADQPLQKLFWTDAVREDVLKRADRDISVLGGPLVKIVENQLGKTYVANRVNQISPADFKTFEEGAKWLENAGPFLSDSNRQQAVEATGKLPPDSLLDIVRFLKAAEGELSPTEINKIIERAKILAINSVEESVLFLKAAGRALSSEERTETVNRTPLKTLSDGVYFLREAGELLSQEDKRTVIRRAKGLPTGYDTPSLVSFLRLAEADLSPADITGLTERISIPVYRDGFLFLIQTTGFLSSKDRMKILEKTPVNSAEEGLKLLGLSSPASSLSEAFLDTFAVAYQAVTEWKIFSQKEAAKIIERTPINSRREWDQFTEQIAEYISQREERGLPNNEIKKVFFDKSAQAGPRFSVKRPPGPSENDISFKKVSPQSPIKLELDLSGFPSETSGCFDSWKNSSI